MDLRSKLSLDGSDFNKTIQDAGKQVNEFQKKAEDTSKSINGMGNASSRTAKELLSQMKNMENLGRSTSNYRQQLGQITREISDLSINYRAMSDEMKNSDFGKEVAAKIDELTSKAGQYKDAMIDAQMSVKALASDTAGWDATKQGIDVVSSALQTFVATGVLGKESTEKMVAVLAKLKAMEAATSAVIKIGNALQKQSALMMGVAKVQSLALAKAKTLEAASTGKATIAQKIFNAVAKANPYVLLATALIAVGTALVAFARKSDEAKRKEEELQKEAEKAVETFNKWKDAMASAIGNVLGKFTQLQMQWKTLRTEAEKKQWIKDNTKEFENLGLKVNDVNDAEKILVENADDVVEALRAKAKAMAMLNLAAEAQADLVKAEIERDKQVERNAKLMKYVTPGASTTDTSVQKAWDEMGLQRGVDYKVMLEAEGDYIYERFVIEKSGIDKVNAYQEEQANKEVKRQQENLSRIEDYYAEYVNEATDAANKIKGLTSNGPGGGGGGGGSTGPTFDKYSVAWYDSEIQKINNSLKNQVHTYEEIKALNEEIAKLQVGRDRATGKRLEMIELPNKEQQLKMPATAVVQDIEFEDVTFFDLNEKIGDALSGMQSLNSAVSSLGGSIKELGEGWDDNKTAVENITGTIGNMLNVMQSVVSILDTMNSLSEIFNGLSMVQWMLERKKASEKAKELALEGAQTGTKTTNTLIDVVGAIASAIKSASSTPVIGWVLGLGAAAAIIAMLASAKSKVQFAQGGIVPGSSFSGDKIAAQLNSGEMVLNTAQQARLFSILDGKQGYDGNGGKVEFVLKGQELRGVLNNYDKKMSHI